MNSSLFFPPGVQIQFFDLLPNLAIPESADAATAERMAALWLRRNHCPEGEIAEIDAEMLSIAVAVAAR